MTRTIVRHGRDAVPFGSVNREKGTVPDDRLKESIPTVQTSIVHCVSTVESTDMYLYFSSCNCGKPKNQSGE